MLRLALILFTALSSFASAQTLDEIIAGHLKALGRDKQKTIESVKLTGNFELGVIQAGFTQTFKRPMKVRLDASIQGMNLIQAYDGQTGWQVVPFTGKTQAEMMSADELKRIQEEADFDGPLMNYKQKGNSVELVAKEKLSQGDAYHLKITLKNGGVRHIYLAADTFLTTKMTFKANISGNEVELETLLHDYKDVDGFKFPFSIEQHSSDTLLPAQKITLSRVELNVPVDDSIFRMPPATPEPASTARPDKPK